MAEFSRKTMQLFLTNKPAQRVFWKNVIEENEKSDQQLPEPAGLGRTMSAAGVQKMVAQYVTPKKLTLLSTITITVMLQASNLLLLVTVGIVIATAPNYSALIQNFITTEVIIHVHEFVPKALKIRDKSSWNFNVSWGEGMLDLLRIKCIPPLNDRVQQRVTENIRKTVFFAYVVFITVTYFATRIVCRDYGNEK